MRSSNNTDERFSFESFDRISSNRIQKEQIFAFTRYIADFQEI